MLKERYGMSHGSAHRVSLVARDRLAQPRADSAVDIPPNVQDVYTRLLKAVNALGRDIEQAPKKGYVSLRRRKQFGMLQPRAKLINVGLILPTHSSAGRLEPAAKWNALFTHRARVGAVADVDRELESWLRAAYDAAG
jgi:hypothetical protein